MRRIFNKEVPFKKILFLGYDEKQTKIIKLFEDYNCTLDHTNEKLNKVNSYDFVVCFGYRHIIRNAVIKALNCPIFNLHISYLPYNRGAHPNFWSFYDETPSGVTLHLIDEGIDTGPIVDQKYVKFDDSDNTFEKTYKVLIQEIECLFIDNFENLIYNNWTSTAQKGIGTFHSKKDLPKDFSGWKSNILDELKRLKS